MPFSSARTAAVCANGSVTTATAGESTWPERPLSKATYSILFLTAGMLLRYCAMARRSAGVMSL
jgi:hypothetical protein